VAGIVVASWVGFAVRMRRRRVTRLRHRTAMRI
jgi:hypothetical protein